MIQCSAEKLVKDLLSSFFRSVLRGIIYTTTWISDDLFDFNLVGLLLDYLYFLFLLILVGYKMELLSLLSSVSTLSRLRLNIGTIDDCFGTIYITGLDSLTFRDFLLGGEFPVYSAIDEFDYDFTTDDFLWAISY